MIPRPQTSTLFPYTTLFRSVRERDVGRAIRLGVHRAAPVALGFIRTDEETVVRSLVVDAGRAPWAIQVSGAALQEKKKKKHLNSSHSQISYAVFCLKKKNN